MILRPTIFARSFLLLFCISFYNASAQLQGPEDEEDCPWTYDERIPSRLRSHCICAMNGSPISKLSIQCHEINAHQLVSMLVNNQIGADTPIEFLHLNASRIIDAKGEVPPRVFRSIKVMSLQLSNCGIRTINEDAFSGQERTLKHLSLTHNSMEHVSTKSFSKLINLVLLDLSYNKITQVPPHAFKGLRRVATLKLNDNNLRVSSNAFQGLTESLKNLNLKGTGITEVPRAISNLSSLVFLDLSQNRIEELKSHQFESLHSLTALNLEKNLLQRLPRSTFNGVNDTLSSLSLLNNLVTEFPEEALRTLKELRVLDLGFNLITDVPQDAFHGLKSLTLLALDGNPLTTLPYDSFSYLNNTLKGLSMGGRFLNCDCRLKWITHWIEKNSLQVTSRERNPKFCGSPPSLRSIDFYSIDSEDMKCTGGPESKEISRVKKIITTDITTRVEITSNDTTLQPKISEPTDKEATPSQVVTTNVQKKFSKPLATSTTERTTQVSSTTSTTTAPRKVPASSSSTVIPEFVPKTRHPSRPKSTQPTTKTPTTSPSASKNEIKTTTTSNSHTNATIRSPPISQKPVTRMTTTNTAQTTFKSSIKPSSTIFTTQSTSTTTTRTTPTPTIQPASNTSLKVPPFKYRRRPIHRYRNRHRTSTTIKTSEMDKGFPDFTERSITATRQDAEANNKTSESRGNKFRNNTSTTTDQFETVRVTSSSFHTPSSEHVVSTLDPDNYVAAQEGSEEERSINRRVSKHKNYGGRRKNVNFGSAIPIPPELINKPPTSREHVPIRPQATNQHINSAPPPLPSNLVFADKADLKLEKVARSQDSIKLYWQAQRPNVGFRIMYRRFGDETYNQSPPLAPTEKDYTIKNIDNNDCMVVCVVLYDELAYNGDASPPRSQCKELRPEAQTALINHMDKITIGASAAICATVILAVIIFIGVTRRAKSAREPSALFEKITPASLMSPSPGPKNGASGMMGMHKDWDQISAVSARSIPRAQVYHGNGTMDGARAIGMTYHRAHPEHQGSNRAYLSHHHAQHNQSIHSYHGTLNGQALNHTNFNHPATLAVNNYLANQSRLLRASLGSKSSQDALNRQLPPTSQMHRHYEQNHKKRRIGRLTQSESLHTLSGYDTPDNWTDHDMDVYVARNATKHDLVQL